MSKAVQDAVQERDKAVQPEVTFKTPVRGSDERAFLVSERSAAWGPRAVALPPFVEAGYESGALGPVPTSWTADLVHCRLQRVNSIALQLPRVKVPGTYRSFLGELQPQDAAPLGRRRVLTDEDTQIFDWTMSRLYAWSEIDRAILMGVMSGYKLSEIVTVIFGIAARRGGKAVKRSAVHKRYHQHTATMAEEWIALGEPIDEATRECWIDYASKKK